MIRLNLEFIHSGARAPSRAHASDAGWDLYAPADHLIPSTTDYDPSGYEVEIHSNRYRIPLGLKLAIPAGYYGMIAGRSGLAAKGISTHYGIIDPGYRGEVCVLLTNNRTTPYPVKQGDRVAQLLILPLPQTEIAIVDSLDATARGAGGFGSSGR